MKQSSENHKAKGVFAGCCMLGLIFVGMVCNTAGLYFTYIAEELNAPMWKVTLIMSFLTGGGLWGMVFAGKVFSRTDGRMLLSACVAVVGGGLTVSAFSHSIYLFYVVWGIIGFCTPFLMTVGVTTILGNWFPDSPGAVLGFTYGIAGLGGMAANAILGKLIMQIGWRSTLVLEGILTMIFLLPFTIFFLKTEPEEGEAFRGKNARQQPAACKTDGTEECTVKEAFCSKSFYLFVLANMALTVVSSLIQIIASHIVNIGFNIQVGSMVMSSVMAGCALGNVLMGWLLDCFPAERVIFSFSASGAIGLLCMAVSRKQFVLIVAGIFAGMGQSVFQTSISYCVRRRFGSKFYSEIYSQMTLPGSVIGIFTGALGGAVYDLTGNYIFLMVLLSSMYVIAALCIVVGLHMKGKKKKFEFRLGGF